MIKKLLAKKSLKKNKIQLTQQKQEYLMLLLNDNNFDVDFYRHAVNITPQNEPFYYQYPQTHYIQNIHNPRLKPFKGFDPSNYTYAHYCDKKDVILDPYHVFLRNNKPSYHYSHNGKEHRPYYQRQKAIDESYQAAFLKHPIQEAQNDGAIYLHIFYDDVFEEILEYIKPLSHEHDFIMTVTENVSQERKQEILDLSEQFFKNITMINVPNHGRDICPFLMLNNAGYFTQYDRLLKLHSKKSLHIVEGNNNRKNLIIPIVPPRLSEYHMNLLRTSSEFGIAHACQFLRNHDSWFLDLGFATKALTRMDITFDPKNLVFPAGSMYWIHQDLLTILKRGNFNVFDFELENKQYNSTFAHGIERAMGYLCKISERKLMSI